MSPVIAALSSFATAAILVAQVPPVATPEPVAPPATAEIWLIGASLTNGFIDPAPLPDGERNSSLPLARALRLLWGEAGPQLVDRSDSLTFEDPGARQEVALRNADLAKPALVLGVDFPFWFGYGYMRGPDEDAERLELQRRGLAMLAQIDAPIVLGDYPDMTGAARRMLSPRQIPAPETLERLNAELRAFADAREHVTVFPLAAFVAQLKSDGLVVRYGHRDVRLTPADLLQGDRLHPTRLGMAVLAARLAEHLRERFPAGHPLRPADRSFERLVADAGADDLIEWLIEQQGEAEAATTTPTGGRGKRR